MQLDFYVLNMWPMKPVASLLGHPIETVVHDTQVPFQCWRVFYISIESRIFKWTYYYYYYYYSQYCTISKKHGWFLLIYFILIIMCYMYICIRVCGSCFVNMEQAVYRDFSAAPCRLVCSQLSLTYGNIALLIYAN